MAMEMDHSFTVPVPPERAWDVLLDVEKIAPCMPGATVDEFDGEVVTGRIKVKVGPVSLTYRGTAKFTERDADASGTTQDGPGSTQPSPVVPAAAITPTPTTQPPAASADSINLVKLVGPALLKRVIPVAVVAAALALLGRRLFRRGAKG